MNLGCARPFQRRPVDRPSPGIPTWVSGVPWVTTNGLDSRASNLARAAVLIKERREELARTIAAEAGKALKFARAEADRGYWTFQIASEEARRLHGETIPLDGVPAGEGYFGFWQRRPVA